MNLSHWQTQGLGPSSTLSVSLCCQFAPISRAEIQLNSLKCLRSLILPSLAEHTTPQKARPVSSSDHCCSRFCNRPVHQDQCLQNLRDQVSDDLFVDALRDALLRDDLQNFHDFLPDSRHKAIHSLLRDTCMDAKLIQQQMKGNIKLTVSERSKKKGSNMSYEHRANGLGNCQREVSGRARECASTRISNEADGSIGQDGWETAGRTRGDKPERLHSRMLQEWKKRL